MPNVPLLLFSKCHRSFCCD